MGFTVVHPNNSQTLWVPVAASQTIYTGAIVCFDTNTPAFGVKALGKAGGVGDMDNLDVPFGVVVGNNAISSDVAYSSTYFHEYITAGAEAGPHDSTTQYQGVEGVVGHGEKGAYVEVIPITAETVLRGSIYNGAMGTAPTAEVADAASTDGLDPNLTTATDVAPVANWTTCYCRTGANMGLYRIADNTAATSTQTTPAFPSDIAVGDTFIYVNLRPWGLSRVQFDSASTFIDGTAAMTAEYYFIDVLRLDLSEANNEYCEFRFSAVNFIHTDRSDSSTAN